MIGRASIVAAVLAVLVGCSRSQDIDPAQQVGPNPVLPKINEPVVLPRTVVPPVVGWKAGETPSVPAGFRVQAMATGLMSPRNVYALPNGDMLVVQALKEAKESRTELVKLRMGNLQNYAKTAKLDLESEATQLSAIYATIIRNMEARLAREKEEARRRKTPPRRCNCN